MLNRRSFLKAAGLVAGATAAAPGTLFGDLPDDRPIQQPGNLTELLRRRSEHGKLYLYPTRASDGRYQYRYAGSCGKIHWRNEPVDRWRDIDCTWRERNGLYRVDSVGYRVTWDPYRMMMTYKSLKGGELRLRIAEIDGKRPRTSKVEQFGIGDRLRLRGAADGVDLVVVARGDGPEIYRKVEGSLRPLIAWDVEDDSGGRITTNLGNLVGWDNHDLQVQRAGRRQKLPVEIEYETSRVTADSYRITERLTGRVKHWDRETRVARWESDLVGPAFLDVAITEENITQNNDDGQSYDAGASENWEDSSGGITWNQSSAPAWRFQTVPVPQGATINTATLGPTVSSADATMLASLYGELVASAGVWTNGSANGMTRATVTTAFTAVTGWATTGLKSINIAAQVQEIVNQGAWASDNNMRFGFRDATAGTQVFIKNLNYDGASGAAHLNIDYTSGAAPSSKKLMMTGVG